MGAVDCLIVFIFMRVVTRKTKILIIHLLEEELAILSTLKLIEATVKISRDYSWK